MVCSSTRVRTCENPPYEIGVAFEVVYLVLDWHLISMHTGLHFCINMRAASILVPGRAKVVYPFKRQGIV